MPTVAIETAGCRACALCVGICPTNVFDSPSDSEAPRVAREADCIGCTSCEYICPSRCVDVAGSERQRPFHRVEKDASIVAKMLQRTPQSVELTDAALDEARRDVSVRLRALAASVTETMGRGQRVVGRTAGSLAAEHLPEVYEEETLEGVLGRLQKRFAGSFAFDFNVGEGGSRLVLNFKRCAVAGVVTGGGANLGQATLCVLFHEYWAGLLSAFTKRTFALENLQSKDTCTIELLSKS